MKTSMKKKFRQTLAMLFAVAMVFTSIPQTAYAAEANNVEATEAVETAEEVVEIAEGVEDLGSTVSGNEIYYTVTKNVAEGATVAYLDGCVETVNGLDVILLERNLDFTVEVAEEVKEVKEVDDVVCTVSGNTIDPVEKPTENGTIIYSVASELITDDATITVTLKDKEAAAPEVSTYEVSFAAGEGATVTDVTVDNEAAELTEGKLPSVSANCIVTFKVATEETHKVKSVTAKVGEAEAAEVTANEGVYSVTVTDKVAISIETEAYNKVTFAVDGDEDSYTATVSGNEAPVYEIGDVYYTDEASVQFAFKAADGYKIDKVEVNGEAQTENDAPKMAVELSFAEVKDYTVKVTTSPVENTEDKKVVFANESDYMTYAVTIGDKVVKAAGKSNTYNVLKGAGHLTFTVTATGNYQPVVKMGDKELKFVKGTPKSGKTPYTFNYSAYNLKAGADNIITIGHEIEEKAVTVTYKADEVELGVANINGVRTEKVAEEKAEDGINTIATFAVPYGSTITMTATAKENCKLVNAVSVVGNGKEKKVNAKKNAVTFSVKATDDASTVINSEKLYSVYVAETDGEEIVPVKGVYNVEWLGNDIIAAIIGVRYGEGFSNMQPIKEVSLKDSKKTEIGSTLVVDQGNAAVLTVSGNDAGKTLVASVTINDGTETGKKMPDMKFKVAPVATKVTVKGVKSGVLTQAADTTKEYALTYNAKGVSDIYEAEMTSVSGNTVVGSAEIENGKLVVTTIPGVGEKVAKIRIYNSLTGATLTNGEFDLTITAPAMVNIKPTVKLKSSSDVSLTLTLGAKKVDTPNVGKVWYKVVVTSEETDESIKSAIAKPFYIEKNGDSQDAKLVVNNVEFGLGKSAKFNVAVSLVQTIDKEELTAENEAVKKVFETASAKVAVKKNLATKAPYFETKLGLKKGTTTVYTGQENIVVATAQFGKKTTFTQLAYAYQSAGSSMLTIDENLTDNKIRVSVPANARPGKYTITALAVAPENTPAATASITINVVKSIQNIRIDLPATKVYKQDKKAATITAKAYFNAETYAPKSKKVTWSIVDVETGAPLNNSKITVKNGKVTIAKDYIVDADSKFAVRAEAADWKGNTVYGVSAPITIKATTVALGDMVLVEEVYGENDEVVAFNVVGGSGTTITTEQAEGLYPVVLQKGVVEKDSYTREELEAAMVSPEDVTFSISNKAVHLYSDSEFGVFIGDVTKAVKNVKITATATDGSKKKVVLDKLTIDYPEITNLCLYFSGEESVSANGLEVYVDYSAQANDEVFVNIYDETAEGRRYFDSAVNQTLTIKSGAKWTYQNKEEGYGWFVPTSKTTVLELVDKTKSPAVKKTYKLTNVACQEAAAPAVTISGNHLYSDYYPTAQTVKFEVDPAYAGKTVRVSREPFDNSWKYGWFIYPLFQGYSEKFVNVESDGTFTLTWNEGTEEDPYTYLEKGKYKLYFTFGSAETHEYVDDEGKTQYYTNFTAETATTNVTVKVEKPEVTKSTFRPTTSYTMYVKDGLAVELTGTGKGVNMDTLQFNYLQNVNVNGQANKFADYFVLGEDHRTLMLRDDVNVDDIKTEDLKGYVSYHVEGDHLLNSGCDGTVQIKVKLDKTKTTQKYALSNLGVSCNTVSPNTVSANAVSGNVFAYVGDNQDNKVAISDVYSASEDFAVSVEDGTLYLVNPEALECGSYEVEAYIITDDNRYDYKVFLMKLAYLNEEDEAKKKDLKDAYEKAIQKHGVKVKTTVTIKELAE